MPLVASLAPLVATVRARVLDRGACGPLSPTAALLLMLVASLLAISLMLHCCCELVLMSDNITMAAACWSWCLPISNSSMIKVQLARAGPPDMLMLVGDARMQAGLHTDDILLHNSRMCSGLGLRS